MLYEFQNGKILSRRLEYSAAYHCNLRCRGCSHMSPFVAKRFPAPESFERDLDLLSKVFQAKKIKLVGGEPLLNPDIVALIKIAQRSGIAPKVSLVTNGLLLSKMTDDFWESKISISITRYPGIQLPEKTLATIKAKAAESDTSITWRPREEFRSTIVTEPHRADFTTRMIFRTCKTAHKHHCHLLHEGRLFKCAVPPFLPEYLAALNRDGYDPAVDAFPLNNARDMIGDLKNFLTSTEPLEACRYCLGYVGKKMEHGQLTKTALENPASEPLTRATALSKPKLAMESSYYYGRRLVERLTGCPKW